MVSYYDWSPVASPVLYPSSPVQAVPAWNPPPAVMGSLAPLSGAGHPPTAAENKIPLSFTGCNPATGSIAAGFTCTVTGTGFTGLNWVTVKVQATGNEAYADNFVVISDTTLLMTFDPDSLYATPEAYFVGGYFEGDPSTTYSATPLLTTTP